jgi:hypothetical protein
MIRVFIENLLLFLLPTLIYVAYAMLTRPAADENEPATDRARRAFDDAPLVWLFGAGALMILVTLIAFGSTDGGKPGQVYKPASVRDGKVDPGHFE